MIDTLIEDFKNAYSERGDDLILDNYRLDEGLYIKISEQGNFEHIVVTKNDKKEDIDLSDQYLWFCKRDLVSKYMNSNKAIPSELFVKEKNKKINSKRISSNNYLTWFLKKETFIDEKNKLSKKEILEITESYYENLISKKLNDKAVLNVLKLEFWNEKYDFCKNFILNNFDEIFKIIEENQNEYEKYVKIFFDFEYEIYERESSRYLYHKIFNTDTDKVVLKDTVYGISNFNMGLNLKKPYLEHKTMKNSIPYRISLEDALIGYKYSQYLKNLQFGNTFQKNGEKFEKLLEKEQKNTTDVTYYINLGQNNGEVEIQDFDIITHFKDEIDILIENYLEYYSKDENGVQKFKDYSEYAANSKKGLERAFDDILFNRSLIKNYNSDGKSITPNKYIDKNMIEILLNSRNMLFDFFKKGISENLKIFTEKFQIQLILNHLNKNNFGKAVDAYNLIYSIKKYYQGVNELNTIKEQKTSILEILEDENQEDLQNISQYSFLAGQIVRYILSQSESHKKMHDSVEGFLNRKKVKQLNEELTYWFKRYSHAIPMNHKVFNKSFSMLMAFDSDQIKIDDMFLAGYLANNIFYKKMEEIKNEEE